MNDYQYIKVEVESYIALVTVNRPDALNSLSVHVLRELHSAFTALESDSDTGVIILTGAGDRAFIAGADIKYMQGLDREGALAFGKLGQTLTLKIENSAKPVLVAVNGFALGGGCEISLACHIRIASENAVFGQPEVKLGLIPGWGGTQRLPRIIGRGNATELIVGGHTIGAEEAFRVGLVNKVVPHSQLIAETEELAEKILKNGPNAVAESLRCINSVYGNTIERGLQNEVESFSGLFDNEEANEGLEAFVEKRKPKFRN